MSGIGKGKNSSPNFVALLYNKSYSLHIILQLWPSDQKVYPLMDLNCVIPLDSQKQKILYVYFPSYMISCPGELQI